MFLRGNFIPEFEHKTHRNASGRVKRIANFFFNEF